MAYKKKADAIKYNNEFIKQAYDRVNLTLPKGQKDALQAIAQAQNESLNGFVNTAIDERVARLQGTQDAAQAPESSQDGVLLLREIGHDPKAEKPLYTDIRSGKQYHVMPVAVEGKVIESDLPF